MTVVRRQVTAIASGDPAVATFGLTPLQNSLLLALLCNRSDLLGSPVPTISDFAIPIQRIANPADATFRRGLAVGWKLAGAAEGTSISGDWNNAASTNYLVGIELQGNAGEVFSLLEDIDNDNGAVANAISIPTGTTPSTSGDQLLFGAAALKESAINTSIDTFSGLLNIESFDINPAGSADMTLGLGWAESSVTGVKSSTVGVTGNNNGLLAGLLVFSTAAAGFEPLLEGDGSISDQIFRSLTTQGFTEGTIVDREYGRLLAKLSLAAPQSYSLDDLYSLAGEIKRI